MVPPADGRYPAVWIRRLSYAEAVLWSGQKYAEGGSLTILATALVDTEADGRCDLRGIQGNRKHGAGAGSEAFEKRIFPAIDILKSGTRRDDLLLNRDEAEAVDNIRKATNSMKAEESVEKILDMFSRTRTNREFVEMAKKIRFY